MTLLGKILVCVNLVISLMMAAIGVGVYTNRVNWTHQPTTDTPEKARGELAKRIQAINERTKGLHQANARQQDALVRLRRLEKQRPADKLWYAQQLEHMENKADEKDPVKLLVIQEGKIVTDDNNFGLPALREGKDRSKEPLQSLQSYNDKVLDTYKRIVAERDKLRELVERDSELTRELIGVKGLRQRIEDEEEKRQRVALEIEDFTLPRLLNIQVESELLLKRRNGLEGRKKELEKAPVAPQKP